MAYPRSWLLAGDDLAGALASAADAVVIDLDGAAARAGVDQSLRALDAANLARVWVRIGDGTSGEDDVQLALRHHVAGLVVPRTVGAARCSELDAMLGKRPTLLAAEIGTAAGMLGCGGAAAIGRVAHFVLDEANLRLDLGLGADAGDVELASVRGHLVVVSAAFAMRPPIGPPGSEPSDATLRRAGYGGRLVSAAGDVDAVNLAFGPATGSPTSGRT